MYYAHLKNINFDESIDMLPTNNKEIEAPQAKSNNMQDIKMSSQPESHDQA